MALRGHGLLIHVGATSLTLPLPLSYLVAQMVKNLSAMQEPWIQSLGREDPLEKEMAMHCSILAWRAHGQRGLVGYGPWSQKELDMTERLFHTLS